MIQQRFFHSWLLLCLAMLAESNPAQALLSLERPQSGSLKWTSSQRLSGRGAYPALSYSSTNPGDLRAFYVVAGSSSEKMVVKARLGGLPFGRETDITDSSGSINFGMGARNVGVHYSPGAIDLALSRSSLASILTSTDDGASWVFQRSFSNTGDATASFLPVHFTHDPPDRSRFVYGYIRTLIVPTAFVYAAERDCPSDPGQWCAGNQIFYDDGGSSYPAIGAIQDVQERGPAITLLGGGSVLHSSDNGRTYVVVKHPGDSTVDLSGADMARGAGARLWLIRPYSYGPPPDNYHLESYVSDDSGATWNLPALVLTGSSSAIASPRLAVNGRTIVLVWKHADATTSYRYQSMKSLISRDDGATWAPVATRIALAGTLEIAALELANHQGRFSLVYSVVNGSAPAGVYLTELFAH